MFSASIAKVDSAIDSKETPIASENAPEVDSDQHAVAKRAWNQLQSGWGKRNLDDNSIDDLHRRMMQVYSDQLMANREDSDEYAPEDYDSPSKRAWKQMSNAW